MVCIAGSLLRDGEDIKNSSLLCSRADTTHDIVFIQRRNETPVFSTRGSCILQTSSWAKVLQTGGPSSMFTFQRQRSTPKKDILGHKPAERLLPLLENFTCISRRVRTCTVLRFFFKEMLTRRGTSHSLLALGKILN